MNLANDAMLVALRITAWSGRRYDREASDHVAAAHDASSSAGRYNKLLLPKSAFAALTATVSEARKTHYQQTLPWDDQGSRLLTVANYERYTELFDALRERMIARGPASSRTTTSVSTRPVLTWASSSASRTTPRRKRLSPSFPSATASPRFRTPITSWRASPATTPTGSNATSRRTTPIGSARRVTDLYRRLGEAVDRVSERLSDDDDGKPLVFRDSMIENIRELVDVVPRLNIFGDHRLAALCDQVKQKIACADPTALRPSPRFDPQLRNQVKRDADALAQQFAGYFGSPAGEGREVA